MSGFILCKIPRAQAPYYIDSIGTNIYSIEELCFYFCYNLGLVDSSIMNENLAHWIGQELKLTELEKQLITVLGDREISVRDFIYPIFKEINYLSHEDMKKYDRMVKELEALPLPVRMKGKGDTLMENGMYVSAINVYRKLQEDLEGSDKRSFLSNVYYNMGCAYSRLFQQDEAVECFEKAYLLVHTMDTLVSYLYAYYYAKTPIEYASKLEELGVDKGTRQEIQKVIDQVENIDEPTIMDHQIDGILENMISDYRRSTGG